MLGGKSRLPPPTYDWLRPGALNLHYFQVGPTFQPIKLPLPPQVSWPTEASEIDSTNSGKEVVQKWISEGKLDLKTIT